MRQILFILNERPDGGERAYSGLRLARHLAERDGVAVRVFMTGDGVLCAESPLAASCDDTGVASLVQALARTGEVAT